MTKFARVPLHPVPRDLLLLGDLLLPGEMLVRLPLDRSARPSLRFPLIFPQPVCLVRYEVVSTTLLSQLLV